MEHPLIAAFGSWLPEIDFAVLGHGFAAHGRDYMLVIEAGSDATFELTLTHVVEQSYRTNVDASVWPRSWDDVLIDYAQWEAAGCPDGYLWGTNWSMAYPGITAPDSDEAAERWSRALGKQMFALDLETDRFALRLIFHSAKWRKLSEQDAVSSSVMNPGLPKRG